jgi:hypothetical protein
MISERKEGRKEGDLRSQCFGCTEWFSFIDILWPVIFNLGCANTVLL